MLAIVGMVAPPQAAVATSVPWQSSPHQVSAKQDWIRELQSTKGDGWQASIRKIGSGEWCALTFLTSCLFEIYVYKPPVTKPIHARTTS